MQIDPSSVAWLVTVGVSIGTTIFWGIFHLGQMKSEIVRAHKRIDDHDDVHDEVLAELQLRRRNDHTRHRTSQDIE